MKNNKETRNERVKKELARIKAIKKRVAEKMTPQKLRTFKGFKQVSDEVANSIISGLKELAAITLSQINRKNYKP